MILFNLYWQHFAHVLLFSVLLCDLFLYRHLCFFFVSFYFLNLPFNPLLYFVFFIFYNLYSLYTGFLFIILRCFKFLYSNLLGKKHLSSDEQFTRKCGTGTSITWFYIAWKLWPLSLLTTSQLASTLALFLFHAISFSLLVLVGILLVKLSYGRRNALDDGFLCLWYHVNTRALHKPDHEGGLESWQWISWCYASLQSVLKCNEVLVCVGLLCICIRLVK